MVPPLPDQCSWVDRSGGGGDLWSVWCSRCGCINYLIRARQSHHVNGNSRRVDVCNGSPRRIPLSGVVVVVATVVVGVAAAAAVVVVGGGGLLGKGGESYEVAAP